MVTQHEGVRRLHVAMALYGDLTYDSRVRKEARTLASHGYDVTVVCLAADDETRDLPTNVKVVVCRAADDTALPGQVNPFRTSSGSRLRSLMGGAGWLRAYAGNLRAWGRSAAAACDAVDIWHAHDLTGLAAVAPVTDQTVPIVYDSHELYLETGTAARLPLPAGLLLRRYERRLVSRAAAVITVNDEIADVLRSRYRPRRIEVVHNCPDPWNPPLVRPDLIRAAARIPMHAPVVLYHGMLTSGRGIENLMQALEDPRLRGAHLVLMGSGPRRDTYAEVAGSSTGRRVHILDPVPPSVLQSWVASADVGAMPNPGGTLNDRFSTPNKLFECLAAGVPVVASDFATMRRIVVDNSEGPLGAVCDPSRVEAIAGALHSILELGGAESEALRQRCFAAARDRWNWQSESERLLDVYEDLTALATPRRQVTQPSPT